MTTPAEDSLSIQYVATEDSPVVANDRLAIPFDFRKSNQIVVEESGELLKEGTDYEVIIGLASTDTVTNYTYTQVYGYVKIKKDIPLGNIVMIYRKTPKTQESTYRNNKRLDLKSLENSFDKLTMITQEQGMDTLNNTKDLLKVQTDIEELESRTDAVEQDVDVLDTNLRAAQTDITDLKSKVATNTANIAANTTEITKLKPRVSELETENSLLKDRVKAVEDIQPKTDTRLNALEAKAETVEEGAQANKIETVTFNGEEVKIFNKNADIRAYIPSSDEFATQEELKKKQDIIADLSEIRESASKGATALQSETDPVYTADKPNIAFKSEIPDISTKADKSDIPDISGLATKEEVNAKQDKGDYALKSEIPTKISELKNDKGYLTEHQDISELATKEEVQTDLATKADKSELPDISVKQDVLVSGVNLKTVNGYSLLGDGNITISGEGGGAEDYPDLNFKPSINDVELVGNKTTEDLGLFDGDYNSLKNKPTIPTVPTKVSAFDNDKGYLTEHQSLDGYATQEWVDNKHYLTEHQDISNLATKEELNTKQDTITDLSTIRTNASKGATALQSETDPVYTADKPNLATKSEVTAKQDKLTAGEGIKLDNNTISSTVQGVPIGTVYPCLCTADYVPSGALPCDGAEYTKEQFPDLWNNYLKPVGSPYPETWTKVEGLPGPMYDLSDNNSVTSENNFYFRVNFNASTINEMLLGRSSTADSFSPCTINMSTDRNVDDITFYYIGRIDSQYVAVFDDYNAAPNMGFTLFICTSTDGKTWTETGTVSVNNWSYPYDMLYANEGIYIFYNKKFLVVDTTGNIIQSPYTINYTGTFPYTLSQIQTISKNRIKLFCDGKYFYLNNSSDPTIWSVVFGVPKDTSNQAYLLNTTWSPTDIYARSNNTLYKTSDGINWSTVGTSTKGIPLSVAKNGMCLTYYSSEGGKFYLTDDFETYLEVPTLSGYSTYLYKLNYDASRYTISTYSSTHTSNLIATDLPELLPTCTYTEYQADINTYGSCAKFGIDEETNKFKVPTIKDGDYITQAKSDDVLSKGYKESLPNITGSISNNTYPIFAGADTRLTTNGALGILNPTSAKQSITVGSASQSTSRTIGFDASNSNSTYQDGAKVQGDNVRLRYFVQVTNGTINQSQMDWSQYASGLQGKSNTDLDNLSSAGKKVIDGQWVAKEQVLSTATAVGTYEIDLSDYLPNDNYNYEVLLWSSGYGGGGDGFSTKIKTDFYSDYMGMHRASNSASDRRTLIFNLVVPATSRKIYFTIGIYKAASFSLMMYAYRRIGTNV